MTLWIWAVIILVAGTVVSAVGFKEHGKKKTTGKDN